MDEYLTGIREVETRIAAAENALTAVRRDWRGRGVARALKQAQIVAGYQPIMPTFQGQVTPEQLIQIISYIKSLQAPGQQAPAASPQPAQQTQTLEQTGNPAVNR